MKTITLIATMVFVTFVALAMGSLPQAKMTVKVIDSETGAPISNVVVRTRFLVKQHWNKADEYVVQKRSTNVKGICVLEGEDFSFGYGGRAMLQGFYTSHFKVPYTGKNKVLNRWEPWNPVIAVEMRPKKDPGPMIYKRISREDIPAWDEKVGFDFEAGDWAAPYGKGKRKDILFHASKKGYQGAECHISFSNEMDGIKTYVPGGDIRSEFIFPYLAPTNGHLPTLFKEKWYASAADDPITNAKEDKDINYIFRVRTVVDEDGNIVSSNYGRIKGEIRISSHGRLYFSYWFNPDPQSRSLESDKKPY